MKYYNKTWYIFQVLAAIWRLNIQNFIVIQWFIWNGKKEASLANVLDTIIYNWRITISALFLHRCWVHFILFIFTIFLNFSAFFSFTFNSFRLENWTFFFFFERRQYLFCYCLFLKEQLFSTLRSLHGKNESVRNNIRDYFLKNIFFRVCFWRISFISPDVWITRRLYIFQIRQKNRRNLFSRYFCNSA